MESIDNLIDSNPLIFKENVDKCIILHNLKLELKSYRGYELKKIPSIKKGMSYVCFKEDYKNIYF